VTRKGQVVEGGTGLAAREGAHSRAPTQAGKRLRWLRLANRSTLKAKPAGGITSAITLGAGLLDVAVQGQKAATFRHLTPLPTGRAVCSSIIWDAGGLASTCLVHIVPRSRPEPTRSPKPLVFLPAENQVGYELLELPYWSLSDIPALRARSCVPGLGTGTGCRRLFALLIFPLLL